MENCLKTYESLIGKTKLQITQFLKSCSPASEVDELAIRQFCRETAKVKINFTPIAGLCKITFDDFKEWYYKYIPNRNDIVFLENYDIIGIVVSISYKKVTLGVSLVNSVLNIIETDYDIESIRQADFAEMITLQKFLFKNNWNWNYKNASLKERYIPNNNDWVRLSLLGHIIAYGVFNKISENRDIILYFVLCVDGEANLTYSKIGPEDEFQLESMTMKERNDLKISLAEAKYHWNGHSKRIEPIEMRVQKGQTYYFIDSCWIVQQATDSYKAHHNERFNIGNYFRIKEFAEKVVNDFIHNRNSQIIDIDPTVYNALNTLRK